MMTATEVKERPILFSGEMVRAILDGRKTQTRRPVKGVALEWLGPEMFTPEFVADPENDLCPYGKVGERLWVRETWRYFDAMIETDQEGVYSGYMYRADINPAHDDGLKWRPSIHMPRAASRILLEVVDVRVERLQDISEKDAIAEGVASFRPVPGDGDPVTMYRDYMAEKKGMSGMRARKYGCESAVDSFYSLVCYIYGYDFLLDNPWMWVVEFKQISQ